jgi:spermidine synthase
LTRPWEVLDSRETPDGVLELRRRSDSDFLLCLDGRVLMNSRESRSEEALGVDTARSLLGNPKPRVLIAGLGMGLTLRSALGELPADAQVAVAELLPCVAEWCQDALRELCDDALADPRVRLRIGDVWELLDDSQAASRRFDAIALDLYEGALPRHGAPPVFGREGIGRIRAALAPGGVLARWTEARDPLFERELAGHGFATTSRRVGRGGRRHIVYTARLESATLPSSQA